MNFENIEIGTSDFRTMIGNVKGNGISVEPVTPYFNNLPDVPNWHKVNCAISSHSGVDVMYYVDPDRITEEPDWVRGCNSLGKPHPTIEKMFPHLVAESIVDVITMSDLFVLFDVTGVKRLKIDTEGHDLIIINDYLDAELPLARFIEFESNELIDIQEYEATLDRLHKIGYVTQRTNLNTLCRLK